MASKHPRWSLGELFRSKKRPPPAQRATNPYHAVSIIPGKGACPAAYRFGGMRFLASHAPRLPLPSCDSAHCECKFRHHKDRRAASRRRSDQGLMSGIWNGAERRRMPGRRADDT